MTENTREPMWNIISMALQAGGVVVGAAVGSAHQKAESLQALIYFVPVYASFCLLGAIAAGVALARHERWQLLSFIAIVVNGIPGLFLASIILQKVKF